VTRVLERLVGGRTVTAQALRRAARIVERPGGGKGRLAVLTTGEPVTDQGRLLTVDGLQKLARVLREADADCVLVHAPPIRQAAESWVLAREADALLLVVPADRLRAEEAVDLADVVAELAVPTALLAVQEDARRSRPHVRVRTRPALPLRPRLRLARAEGGADQVQDAERRR